MLVQVQAQKPIPLGGITGDHTHIWDADLKLIDEILKDEQFIDILWRAACRASPKSRSRGRPRMAFNRLLRIGALKHIKDWSFRDLFKEVERNLDYRAFTQIFEQKNQSTATTSRNLARVDGQALYEMNQRLSELACQWNVISGKVYRQDTTVCETNIHYPTDSSLLQDGVRVLSRVTQRAQDVLPSLGRMRDRSRSVRNRVIEIARSTRSRREDTKKRREKAYRILLRAVRPVVTEASRVANKLADGRVTRRLSFMDELCVKALKEELDIMLPRVEAVIRQTRVRICRGVTDYPDKILSIFEPKTAVIRKGKVHKPNEFGRVVDLVEVENGFVSDYQILNGNPSDSALLIPALERHKQRFGRAPHLAATDRGYWSKKNEREAHALGVKRVSIPATGILSASRLRIQRSRWFRAGQRWRANGEGRIGTLKNVYGMDRCMYKGDEAMERWVGWSVFANNLVVVARVLARQRASDENTDTKERAGGQAAA